MCNLQIQMPSLPEWEQVSLADCCTLLSRGRAPDYVDQSDIKAIGQRCVREGGFDGSVARPHNPNQLGNAIVAQHGDVLLNSTGTGTIGRSCIFDGAGTYIVDSHVTVLRPIETRVVPRWLNALLQTQYGQRHLERQCYSGSTNQVELSRVRLANSVVPLPPLPEQRRIAEILDTLDETIRKTEQVIGKLMQMKQGLLHDLLTRGIDENGELRDPERHPEQFKDSPLGRIPRGWTIKAIGDAAVIVMGQSPPGHTYNEDERGLPLINGPVEFGERFPTKIQWTTSPVRVCEPGDVLFCVRGSTTGRMNIANDIYCIGRGVAAIRGRTGETDTAYLEIVLTQLAENILQEAKGSGSTFPSITSKRLAEKLVRVPPLKEQARITECFRAHQERHFRENVYIAKLQTLKQGLMDDLLTGRVRVPVPVEVSS